VQIRDVTANLATLNLCGPRAREVLQATTDDDVSWQGLPFLGARHLELGLARVLAVRIGYVGELGYELYVAQEYAAHVYELLMDAGRDHGIANAGYRAIESRRLEKGYRYWSAELSPDCNPYEAGLGFCVDLRKGPFTGREALLSIKSRPLRRRLVTLSLDGFVPLHGGEPVSLGDTLLGSLTSAGYGHTLGKTIALCYLPAQLEQGIEVTVEAFGQRYAAFPGPRCLYDPDTTQLRA
jgi:4-methylaminobutanoate oxidase (formaldehyde-forming)